MWLWFGLLVRVVFALGTDPPVAFDCAARNLAMELASQLLAQTPGSTADVSDALRLHECGHVENKQHKQLKLNNKDYNAPTFYVATNGSDSNPGTLAAPFATISKACLVSRQVPGQDVPRAVIQIRGGRYFLSSTLSLSAEDSGLVITAYQDEQVLISGGMPLDLTFTASPNKLWFASVPQGSAFTSLFVEGPGADASQDQALVWARTPNGHPERDLQPDGYALVAGPDSSGTWPSAVGAVHLEVGQPKRNSSVYPIFGSDLDPRALPNGWQWFHIGGSASRFADKQSFWNGTVPLGMKFNRTGGVHGGYNVSGFDAKGWTSEGMQNARANVFHTALWGNWLFRVSSVNDSASTIAFDRQAPGGWQEGHGGSMKDQPFFVEGVREALDAEGEWWLDRAGGKLWLMPNSTALPPKDQPFTLRLVAPKLATLIRIQGTEASPVRNVSLRKLSFAHSADTMMEPYEVPSPGDWSIHRGGAVFVQDSEGLSVDQCRFLRLGGNGVFLSRHVSHSNITKCEFARLGETAIATVGHLDLAQGFLPTYPADTLIANNHFHEIGLTGKQSSAWFAALTCRTSFIANVAYNGPRAAVNLNDAFCQGHVLQHNVLFNWVRETQDHGPINTWNRAMYVQPGPDGSPTTTPAWIHITHNFIMNGPSGNRDLGNMFPAVDNDDGSAFFRIANNFMVYGGGKNYLGHDKIWVENVIAYPDRWGGDPCVQIWGGREHVFENNTCVTNDGQPIGLDGNINGPCLVDFADPNNKPNIGFAANNRYFTRNGAWMLVCGNRTSDDHIFTLSEVQQSGWELGTVVIPNEKLPTDELIRLARVALGA